VLQCRTHLYICTCIYNRIKPVPISVMIIGSTALVLPVLGRPVGLLTDVLAHTQSRVTRYTPPTRSVKLTQFIWRRVQNNSRRLPSDLSIFLIWFYRAVKRLKNIRTLRSLPVMTLKTTKSCIIVTVTSIHFSLRHKCWTVMQKNTKVTICNPQET
jgi:hypothetical protein